MRQFGGASTAIKNTTLMSLSGEKFAAVHSNCVGEIFRLLTGQNATRFSGLPLSTTTRNLPIGPFQNRAVLST